MTSSDLAALLSGLGGTSAAVADALRREGCSGKRGNPFFCPVAAYLKRRLGAEASVRADGCTVWPSPGSASVSAPMPGGVRVFLDRFDDGLYPDLEVRLPPVEPSP